MSEQCGSLRAASRSIAPTAELVSTVAQIRTRAGVSGFAEEAMSYMYGDGPGDNVVRFNVPRSDFPSPRCRRRRGGQSATASTFWQVEMSASKATVRLLAAVIFSMGIVLYPQDVRSQAGPYSTPATAETRFCAKPTKELEPPDCSFSNLKDCRAALKAKGGGRCYKQ